MITAVVVAASVVAVAAVGVFYFICVKPTRYWKERGVPTLRVVPICGNLLDVKLGKLHLQELIINHYRAFSNRRYFGFYNMNTPWLIIRDLNLIKKMTTEDFTSFAEHRRVVPNGVDPLWEKSLFAIQGEQKWRNMRRTLSLAFSTKKLKEDFNTVSRCSRKIKDYLITKRQILSIDFKDVATRYACLIIAGTVFNMDSDDEFYRMGEAVSNATGWRNKIHTVYYACPKMANIVKWPMFPEKAVLFFKDLLKKTTRTPSEAEFPTIIQLLRKAQKEDDDIIAQILIFFFGGFDTLSNMICFSFYELAINKPIQDKLYDEINDASDGFQETITYDTIDKMDYLNKVINETLRKWPSFALICRSCTKPYCIPAENPHEKTIHLEVGTVCIFPVYAIHRDRAYYEDPETFNPERFNNVNKLAYFPFGRGPRKCIASQFAMIAAKVLLVEVLKTFEITISENSKVPLMMNRKRNNLVPEGGFCLGLKPRVL